MLIQTKIRKPIYLLLRSNTARKSPKRSESVAQDPAVRHHSTGKMEYLPTVFSDSDFDSDLHAELTAEVEEAIAHFNTTDEEVAMRIISLAEAMDLRTSARNKLTDVRNKLKKANLDDLADDRTVFHALGEPPAAWLFAMRTGLAASLEMAEPSSSWLTDLKNSATLSWHGHDVELKRLTEITRESYEKFCRRSAVPQMWPVCDWVLCEWLLARSVGSAEEPACAELELAGLVKHLRSVHVDRGYDLSVFEDDRVKSFTTLRVLSRSLEYVV